MQSDDKLNISLTAHVLIALTETADKLTGDVKRFSNTGQFLKIISSDSELDTHTCSSLSLMEVCIK